MDTPGNSRGNYYNPNSPNNKPSTGWILVWDMDETLVKGPKHELNTKAIHVLKKAVRKRDGKYRTVDKIFMLTNNSDVKYINFVKFMIYDAIYPYRNPGNAVPHHGIFDGIMSREDISRPHIYDPPKRLKDVLVLMERSGDDVKEEDIRNRVIFFDDIATHKISEQIPKQHYIHIKSDFSVHNTKGRTRWEYVNKLLNHLPTNSINVTPRSKIRTRRRSLPGRFRTPSLTRKN